MAPRGVPLEDAENLLGIGNHEEAGNLGQERWIEPFDFLLPCLGRIGTPCDLQNQSLHVLRLQMPILAKRGPAVPCRAGGASPPRRLWRHEDLLSPDHARGSELDEVNAGRESLTGAVRALAWHGVLANVERPAHERLHPPASDVIEVDLHVCGSPEDEAKIGAFDRQHRRPTGAGTGPASRFAAITGAPPATR